MVATRHSNNRAYSYIRFSTPEQARGDSLRRQTELSERYALDHGLDLDDKLTFKDLGKSAFRGRNVQEGELGDFLKAVEAGKIKAGSYLLVENLDRLSRQPARRAYRQLERIVELGITLVTLQDGKEYTEASLDENFGDLLYALMVLQRGHEESRTKSLRVKAAWAAKRKRATESGTPMTSAVPAWVIKDKATGKFTLDPERSGVVKRIFREASKGNGHHRIAKTFNAEGVPHISRKKNSAAWWPSYILNILRNPAAIGHYQPCKMGGPDGKGRIPEGEVIRDYFPRVIPDRLFYKVRDMRTSKRNASGPKGTHGGNLFTGLARCGPCGAPMHKVNKGTGPKGKQYLVCSRALRRNGCKYQSIRFGRFERDVLGAIWDKIDWAALSGEIAEHSTEALELLDKEWSEKRGELDRAALHLKGIEATMALDHAEGHAPSPRLREQHRHKEHEIASLGLEIANLDERRAAEQGKITHAKSGARSAEAAFFEWMREKRHSPESRARLRSVLMDLVKVIWCRPQWRLGLGGVPSFEQPPSVRPPDAGQYALQYVGDLEGLYIKDGVPTIDLDGNAGLEIVFHVEFHHKHHGKELGVFGFRP
jgi:DNA invertase Pin-like site-specific DNA recombinase